MKRQFSIRLLTTAIAMLCGVFVVGRLAINRHLAAYDLDALLQGDSSIRLTMLKANNHQRRVVCTDADILAYLASVMRQARKYRGCRDGQYYNVVMRFSTGRQRNLNACLGASTWGVASPKSNPSEGAAPTHEIQFKNPVPDRVQALLDFLTAPHSEVAGLSLTVSTNQPFAYLYSPVLHGGDPVGTRVPELASNLK